VPGELRLFFEDEQARGGVRFEDFEPGGEA